MVRLLPGGGSPGRRVGGLPGRLVRAGPAGEHQAAGEAARPAARGAAIKKEPHHGRRKP